MAHYYAIRTRATRPAMLSEGLNEHERESFGRHAAYLQRLVADGATVFVGRTLDAAPSGWAVGIFKAGTEAAARQIMTDDPFEQDGVVTAELFRFDIIVMEPKNE